jgi:hypothetical protein
MPHDNPKLLKNADLVVPMTACPFGQPVSGCPFIPYYELNDETAQMFKIIDIPQEELDDMRRFHHACMAELRKTRRVQFKDLRYR